MKRWLTISLLGLTVIAGLAFAAATLTIDWWVRPYRLWPTVGTIQAPMTSIEIRDEPMPEKAIESAKRQRFSSCTTPYQIYDKDGADVAFFGGAGFEFEMKGHVSREHRLTIKPYYWAWSGKWELCPDAEFLEKGGRYFIRCRMPSTGFITLFRKEPNDWMSSSWGKNVRRAFNFGLAARKKLGAFIKQRPLYFETRIESTSYAIGANMKLTFVLQNRTSKVLPLAASFGLRAAGTPNFQLKLHNKETYGEDISPDLAWPPEPVDIELGPFETRSFSETISLSSGPYHLARPGMYSISTRLSAETDSGEKLEAQAGRVWFTLQRRPPAMMEKDRLAIEQGDIKSILAAGYTVDSKAVPYMEKAFQEGGPEVRAAVLRSLERLGTDEGFSTLQRLSKSPAPPPPSTKDFGSCGIKADGTPSCAGNENPYDRNYAQMGLDSLRRSAGEAARHEARILQFEAGQGSVVDAHYSMRALDENYEAIASTMNALPGSASPVALSAMRTVAKKDPEFRKIWERLPTLRREAARKRKSLEARFPKLKALGTIDDALSIELSHAPAISTRTALLMLAEAPDRRLRTFAILKLGDIRDDKGGVADALLKIAFGPGKPSMRSGLYEPEQAAAVDALGRLGIYAEQAVDRIAPLLSQEPFLIFQNELPYLALLRISTPESLRIIERFETKRFAKHGKSEQMPGGINGWMGYFSNIKQRKVIFARTPGEWESLWEAHAGPRLRPEVDMSKHDVLGIFLGPSHLEFLRLSDLRAGAGQREIVYSVLYPDFVADDNFEFLIAILPKQPGRVVVKEGYAVAMSTAKDSEKVVADFPPEAR